MKKILIGLMVLAMSTGAFAVLTSNGQIAANVASTTDFTAPSYPSAVGASPIAITDGTGVTDALVVNDIVITDNSVAGWTLTVDQTSGNLVHTVNSATVPYSLAIGGVSGTLGTGLTLAPTVGTALTFTALSSTISATGTATTATSGYTFDLLMTIAGLDTAGLLAGNYVETITLALASND